LGGTAFYRHIETGLERVNAAQYEGYFKTLKRQATSVGLPPKAYINGDTAMFTQIARIEPMFNRAVLYPANLLHSGCLPNDISDSVDVKEAVIPPCSSKSPALSLCLIAPCCIQPTCCTAAVYLTIFRILLM